MPDLMTAPAASAPRRGLLGRNSLAWKLILPVPLTLLVLIGLIWFALPRVLHSAAINDAFISNQQTAAQLKAIRGYYSEFVAGKVVRSGAFAATHDHRTNDKAIPIPATLMHDLSGLLAGKETSFTLYSNYPFPGRKERKLDDFQIQALEVLTADPKAVFSRETMLNGQHVVRTAVPDPLSAQTCVNCHNSDPNSPKQDWKLGDVRGALEVVTVIDQQLAHGEQLSNLIVLSAISAGLLLCGFTWWATRGVSRPLAQMVEDMEKLASGRFDVVLPGLHRKDEVGAMARAVEMFKVKAIERAAVLAEQEDRNERAAADERRAEIQRFADGFEAAVGAIVNIVSSESKGLEAAASTLMSSADTTKELSGVVADASREASSNVHSVAVATEELTDSVKEISRHVSESGIIARDAVRQAEMTDGRIAALSTAATRVGNVVKLITGIAQQTNLLALNATIEAARAGEAGRGFAVVAAEVKMLATQTAKATEDIGAQIAEIQAATRDSVSAIKDVGATISRIADIATVIAAAIDQQGATTQQIASNVGSAAGSAERVATNIGDVNHAAGETGAASGRVLASARQLSSEGDKLKAEVERFLAMVRAA